MSVEIISQLSLLGVVFFGVIWFLVRARRKRDGKSDNTYHWQPEQDYDVVQRGESAMTPPWPELKKRQKDNSDKHARDFIDKQ